MRSSKKLCVITATRAEYGLLYGLLKEVVACDDLELQIIATGMHLSPEFGLTYRQIEKDGFQIDKKVETLLSSDTPTGVSKSMGLGMIGFADALAELRPDLLVVLGDRFETFSAVSAAAVARIPVAHIHGGEVTQGAFDESFRHSITKMSHLHFTCTEEYRNRVIQLGEHPNRVFNVGALGVDNIKRLKLLSRTEFEKSIDFKLGKHNFLITFHPVTLEQSTSEAQFGHLLAALDEREDTYLLFTRPNADTNSRIINKMIDKYVKTNPKNATAYTSLGQLRYLSAMQYVDAVVGNSSSGIIEAPSFRIGTINIGDRQQGRIKADSIIDCSPDTSDIRKSLELLFSSYFQKNLKDVVNPNGEGGAAKAIIQIIRHYKLTGILKKGFFDLEGFM